MSKRPLFDGDLPSPDPDRTDLDDAQTEIGDLLDKWQTLLSEDDWATVVRTVSVFFKLTSMEEKKPKRGKR